MVTPLDRIDRELLAALQKNARTSNKDLAARVGLSPSTCLERVRRLQRDRVLRGFHAEVEPRAMGVNLRALIMIQLRKHSREAVESFRDHLLSLPEVTSVSLVAGEHDFLVHVAVPDTDHLRNMELDQIARHAEVVHVQTTLVFDHWTRHVSPFFESE